MFVESFNSFPVYIPSPSSSQNVRYKRLRPAEVSFSAFNFFFPVVLNSYKYLDQRTFCARGHTPPTMARLIGQLCFLGAVNRVSDVPLACACDHLPIEPHAHSSLTVAHASQVSVERTLHLTRMAARRRLSHCRRLIVIYPVPVVAALLQPFPETPKGVRDVIFYRTITGNKKSKRIKYPCSYYLVGFQWFHPRACLLQAPQG